MKRLWVPLVILILAACNQLDAPQKDATPGLDTQAACAPSGSTVTCTYGFTGSEETFVVPTDVTSVTVVARGAPGSGAGLGDGTGGRGAEVSAALAVTSGQTLYLNVGGAPTGAGSCYGSVACVGGFNGGGSSPFFGGGGGGASDVRTVSRSASSGSLESRLLVAAGGGGGGDFGFCPEITNTAAGGDAGNAGADSDSCEGQQATGGGAGTQTAGGSGGSPGGQAGSLGQGGNGGSNTGGGGGGGLYGGGGGGESQRVDGDGVNNTGAGGGGGGSSLDPDGGTITLDDTRTPQITVSYSLPDTTGPSVTVNQAETQADPTTSSPVYFTVTFSETIDETTLAFNDFSVSGTVGAMIIDVAEITRGSVYQLTLGPATSGTIIVSLPADKVTDTAGNPNSASTSTDNTVTYVIPAPISKRYTIDFDKTVPNKLVYSVKVGSGVTYQGQGSASSATVPVVGKRASNGRILEAHVARVVSIYGSKRLIIGSSASSNTPSPTGGRIKLSFTNFDPAGAKLTSMTLSNLVKRGAYLTFYYVNGSSSRQNLGTTSAGGSLVVPLDVKNLRAVDVYAPNAYSVDDVKFEVAPPR